MADILVIDGVEVILETQTTVEVIDTTVAAEVIEAQAQGPIGPQGPIGLSGSSINSFPAATALSGHVAIVLDADGKAMAADSSVATHYAVTGITLGAAAQGAATETTSSGIIEHLGWTFTPDAPVFLGLAGVITQVLPPTAVFSKVLGVAVSPTRISVDFQPAIFF